MRGHSVRRGEIISFSRVRLEHAAKRLLNLRQLRSELFGSAIAREVAWDILLTLYAYDRRFTVRGLTDSVGSPLTTVLRWLDYLESRNLVQRDPHPTDRRSTLIELAVEAEKLLEAYLIETLARRGIDD